MRRGAAILALIAVAAVGATAISGAGAGAARKTKKVDVGDTYFAPQKVKIRKGHRVKWVWTDDVVQPHNVWLTQAPRGVKKKRFRSADSFKPGFTFRRTFKKRGRYHFVCTWHKGLMEMNVRVRR